MYAIIKNGMVCAALDNEHTLCGRNDESWIPCSTGIVTCHNCAKILDSLQGTQYRNGALHGRPMKLKMSDLPTLDEMRKAIERT